MCLVAIEQADDSFVDVEAFTEAYDYSDSSSLVVFEGGVHYFPQVGVGFVANLVRETLVSYCKKVFTVALE